MKPQLYDYYEQTVTGNKVDEYHQELSDIVNTKVPILGSPKKTLERMYHQLEELYQRVKNFGDSKEDSLFAYQGELRLQVFAAKLALELYSQVTETVKCFRKDIQERNPNHKENLDSPRDYIFHARGLITEAVKGRKSLENKIIELTKKEEQSEEYVRQANLLREFTNYALMTITEVVHNAEMDYSSNLHLECMKALEKCEAGKIASAFNPYEKHLKRFDSKKERFPSCLDYTIVLPSVLSALKREYLLFKENQVEYCQRRDDEIMAEMRKVVGKPPQLAVVPQNTPSTNPEVTLH